MGFPWSDGNILTGSELNHFPTKFFAFPTTKDITLLDCFWKNDVESPPNRTEKTTYQKLKEVIVDPPNNVVGSIALVNWFYFDNMDDGGTAWARLYWNGEALGQEFISVSGAGSFASERTPKFLPPGSLQMYGKSDGTGSVFVGSWALYGQEIGAIPTFT